MMTQVIGTITPSKFTEKVLSYLVKNKCKNIYCSCDAEEMKKITDSIDFIFVSKVLGSNNELHFKLGKETFVTQGIPYEKFK